MNTLHWITASVQKQRYPTVSLICHQFRSMGSVPDLLSSFPIMLIRFFWCVFNKMSLSTSFVLKGKKIICQMIILQQLPEISSGVLL